MMETTWIHHHGDEDTWYLCEAMAGAWIATYWVPGRRLYSSHFSTVTLPDDLTLDEALGAAKVIILAQRGK